MHISSEPAEVKESEGKESEIEDGRVEGTELQGRGFFFLHVLCLYVTLWVMTDLSVSTYKKLARLVAH